MSQRARRGRLSEEQILQLTDSILERRRPRRRRRVWLLALAASVAIAGLAVAGLSRTPAARLVPLALSAPGLVADAVMGDRLVLPRETIQGLMLHELESRGLPLEGPITQLLPPDRVVLTGLGPQGPVRIELRAIQAGQGRWLVGLSGMPGATGETRVDPSSRLPAGRSVRRAAVESNRVVIELEETPVDRARPAAIGP